MTTTRSPSSFLTSLVVSSRYMPVYIAIGLLLAVAAIWAPAALSQVSLKANAPTAALLAITALGQMLVIMTGGIDLSTPGTMSLAALIMVGVGDQADENIATAIMVALLAAAAIGLVNGILIGGLKLNALIVTLAMGQIVVGVVSRYGQRITTQSPVPAGFTEWTSNRLFGVGVVFWIGVLLTIVLVVGLRYTSVGRRFQAVGANPVATHVAGVRVTANQIFAYVAAALFYAVAGLLLAGMLRSPGVSVGREYLLGPIAAVVIGGASLTGGLASPSSTLVAAIFLTGLDQTMRTMGLHTNLQYVVFGLVIIGGMLVSGDRITKGVERLLRERRRPIRNQM